MSLKRYQYGGEEAFWSGIRAELSCPVLWVILSRVIHEADVLLHV